MYNVYLFVYVNFHFFSLSHNMKKTNNLDLLDQYKNGILLQFTNITKIEKQFMSKPPFSTFEIKYVGSNRNISSLFLYVMQHRIKNNILSLLDVSDSLSI